MALRAVGSGITYAVTCDICLCCNFFAFKVAPYSSSLKQGEKCILPIATDILMFVKHLALFGEKTDNVAIMCPTYKFNINHTRIAMATAAYELL
jgi:hypothetical protein